MQPAQLTMQNIGDFAIGSTLRMPLETVPERAFTARQASHPGGVAVALVRTGDADIGHGTTYGAHQGAMRGWHLVPGTHMRLQVIDQLIERLRIFVKQRAQAWLTYLRQGALIQGAVIDTATDQCIEQMDGLRHGNRLLGGGEHHSMASILVARHLAEDKPSPVRPLFAQLPFHWPTRIRFNGCPFEARIPCWSSARLWISGHRAWSCGRKACIRCSRRGRNWVAKSVARSRRL